MTTTDDLLKMIGIGAIGIIGIGIVLVILAVMCIVVGVFIFGMQESASPTVTVSPYEYYPTASTDNSAANVYANSTLFNQTKVVPDGYYQSYSMVMSPGDGVDVSVSTDGSPVDVMMMDSANFGKYVTAINNPKGGTWDNYVNDKSVDSQVNFSFVASDTDRYYVIVDNTKSPVGGAYANKNVTVHTLIMSA